MTSPFGKVGWQAGAPDPVHSSGWAAPTGGGTGAPVAPGWAPAPGVAHGPSPMPPAHPGVVPASGLVPGPGSIDGVGAYVQALLVPGERVLASIGLHEGDLTVTDRRILVQRREFSLFGLSVNARATYAIRRHQSVSIAVASVTDVARQLFALLLFLAGVGPAVAALIGGSATSEAAGAGLCLVVVAILLFATARKAALVVDAGSDRATVQIRSGERSRADEFFRQAAALLLT